MRANVLRRTVDSVVGAVCHVVLPKTHEDRFIVFSSDELRAALFTREGTKSVLLNVPIPPREMINPDARIDVWAHEDAWHVLPSGQRCCEV